MADLTPDQVGQLSDSDWLNYMGAHGYPSLAGAPPSPPVSTAQPAPASTTPPPDAQAPPASTAPATQPAPDKTPDQPQIDPYRVVAHAISLSENPYLDANAKNPGSTATGNGQFIEGTWLKTVQQYRPDLLQGRTTQQVLDLRKDPILSDEMTANLAKENGIALGNAGLPVDAGTLYMAHSLGVGGAIQALRANPNTPLGQIIGWDTLSKNPAWGRNPTVAGFRNLMTGLTQAKMAETDDIDARLQKLIGNPDPPAQPPANTPPAQQQSTGFPNSPQNTTSAPPPAPQSTTPPDDTDARLAALIGTKDVPATQFNSGYSQAGAYGAQPRDRDIPQPGGPNVPLPAATNDESVGDAISKGYQSGQHALITKEFAANHPWIANVVAAPEAVLAGGNALWQGALHAAVAGADMLPDSISHNAGGDLGRAIAGGMESEATRSIAERPIVPAVEPTPKVPEPTAPPKLDPATFDTPASQGGLTASQRIDALNERNGTRPAAGVPDSTTYVPGTAPPLAQRVPTEANIAKYKAVDENTGDMQKVQDADNAARVAHADEVDTSQGHEQTLRNDRQMQADQDLRGAWQANEPVNVGGVVADTKTALAGDMGLRPAIAGPVTEVVTRLQNAAASDGSIMPQRLYAVRQSINDMLDRTNPNNAGNLQARAQLTDLGNKLDTIIHDGTTGPVTDRIVQAADAEKAANIAGGMSDADAAAIHGHTVAAEIGKRMQGADPADVQGVIDRATSGGVGDSYGSYKTNYATNSKPLNEIRALRDSGYDGLTDGSTMTLQKVQRVIDNLRSGVTAGDRDAGAVTSDTWNRLFNLRDDLARKENLVNPTSGNVKPAAQPSPAMRTSVNDTLSPNSKLYAALPHLGNFLLNMGIGHGALGPLAGTALDAMMHNAIQTGRQGALTKASRNMLQQWSDDQMRQHPAWDIPPPGSNPMTGLSTPYQVRNATPNMLMRPAIAPPTNYTPTGQSTEVPPYAADFAKEYTPQPQEPRWQMGNRTL